MEQVCPDLIVADVMMPRMDGYALYGAVRARPEWVAIPFIFLTAKAEREDVLKGKALGAEDYITKPFDPEELIVAVRARLGRAKAIRQVTKAEFDQLKQQIIIALGHELRTPLTYLLGYTQVAVDDIASLSPEEFQQFLVAINRGTDRLARLVENLLLLVRLDTGQAAEEFRLMAQTSYKVGDLVERTVRSFEQQAMAHNIVLESKVEPGLPPVRLHPALFADALSRLVDNGFKFSKGQDKRVTVRARAREGWVEISVADNGVGIPLDQLPHLFERFRQINRKQLEQQGVGLGLSIASELIHLHGGDITVASILGEGSTFTIRLPIVL
jgi:signal transduction histidine kinase